MHIDIIIPDRNEHELIEMAKRLDWDALCLVYEKRADADHIKGLKSPLPLIFASHIEKNASLRLMRGTGEDRTSLERGGFDLYYGMEETARHDRLHHREGGLNHVLCKLMHKHGIVYGINFDSVLNAEATKRAILIGRMRQNFKLCADADVPIVVASFATTPYQMRTPHDLRATMLSFGMNTAQAKESILHLGIRLANHLK
ncbi:hypothetical protein HY641_04845 [Candidatus Woesearchaeota archaeon]|nr:hypothetical protein [Candidatus Woesearchaeota archaeon]